MRHRRRRPLKFLDRRVASVRADDGAISLGRFRADPVSVRDHRRDRLEYSGGRHRQFAAATIVGADACIFLVTLKTGPDARRCGARYRDC